MAGFTLCLILVGNEYFNLDNDLVLLRLVVRIGVIECVHNDLSFFFTYWTTQCLAVDSYRDAVSKDFI